MPYVSTLNTLQRRDLSKVRDRLMLELASDYRTMVTCGRPMVVFCHLESTYTQLEIVQALLMGSTEGVPGYLPGG